MGALEGLGGQIFDTFVKSEGWGGGPGAEGTGVGDGEGAHLGPLDLHTYRLEDST